MNILETTSYLTWLSQSDGRVKVTDPNVQIWAAALAAATNAEVREATLAHYRGNDTCVTPHMIRKACAEIRERTTATQSALTAGPALTAEVPYDAYVKHIHRPEFQAMFEAGRREGNAHRAYKQTLRETGSRELAKAAGERARAA